VSTRARLNLRFVTLSGEAVVEAERVDGYWLCSDGRIIHDWKVDEGLLLERASGTECPHCAKPCASPAGLSAHIRGAHPELR
jgi:hypothetical protein